MKSAAAFEPPAVARTPEALPHFAHIRRSWDATLNCSIARLMPGEYYVTRHDETLFTVLGSCVSACVRDRKLGLGGMNHFMLPTDSSGGAGQWAESQSASETRYGSFAMQRLIQDILDLGGQRADLEFKVFGGGKVLDIALDVGNSNVQFVREFLARESFTIAAEDLGADYARKLFYSPRTGQARVKRLAATVNRVVFEREQSLTKTTPIADDSKQRGRGR
jgi:chemotaxis protein CheD